jgi:hypothetical protein
VCCRSTRSREKKIGAMPDWKKALRPEFMQRARG